MKYCKDCNHILIEQSGIYYAKCKAHPRSPSITLMVTGQEDAKAYDRWFYCSESRADANKCGHDAIKFEQKGGQ